jgi:hypothetical protein
MKRIIYIPLLSLLASCASSQHVTVRYKAQNQVNVISDRSSHTIQIPKGYHLFMQVGGHKELEKQYIYPDSTKIYITSLPVSMLNYDHILSLGNSISKKRFESIDLKAKLAKTLGKEFTPETVILQGKTNTSLYWKDIRIGYISIGYVNVPASKKDEYDKVLSSFK